MLTLPCSVSAATCNYSDDLEECTSELEELEDYLETCENETGYALFFLAQETCEPLPNLRSHIYNVPATQELRLNATYAKTLYPRMPSDFAFTYKVTLRPSSTMDMSSLNSTEVADILQAQIAIHLGITDVNVTVYRMINQGGALEVGMLVVLPTTATLRDAFHVNRVLTEGVQWNDLNDDWELSVEIGERDLDGDNGTETLKKEMGMYSNSVQPAGLTKGNLALYTTLAAIGGILIGALVAAKFVYKRKDPKLNGLHF